VDRPEPGLRRAFVVFAITLGATVVASGLFWFTGQRERHVAESWRTLDAIARLKAAEVSAWHNGQLSTARALAAMPFSARTLEGLRAREAETGTAGHVAWLDSLIANRELIAAAVYDASGRLLAYGTDARMNGEAVPRFASRVLAARTGDRILVDEIEAHGSHVHLRLWAPMRAVDSQSSAPSAWLLLSVDVSRTLYPIVARLPIETRTGEVAFWRMRGDSLEALSPLRYVPNAALRYRTPTARSAVATAHFTSHSDSQHVADYRGVPVVAAVRRVPATDWVLVAKIDRAEVIAPVIRGAVVATLISLILLGAIAAVVYAMWSRRDRAQTDRELALIRAREASVEELRLSEARYARAMRGTTDGLWDRDIVTGATYVSPRWREIMGIPDDVAITTEEEMQFSVLSEDAPRQREAMARHLTDGAPYDIELRVLRSDGAIRWIRTRGEAERNADGNPIRMAGAISDVTDRHLAEATLARVDRILRMRSAVDQSMVRATSERELLQAVCETGATAGGYRLAWIGYKQDDAARSVKPMAMAGADLGYLEGLQVSWSEVAPNGQGPTGRCIRSGEVYAAQNLRNEAGFGVWRELAEKYGFQSSIAIPIRVGQEVVGALMLYAADAYAFDVEEIALLTELGQDISFGIGSLRDHVTLTQQREQLTLFRQVIDQSTDAIFVADVQTGRFLDFNAAALKELGYTADELRALHVWDIAAEVSSPHDIAPLANEIRAQNGLLMRSDHRTKDGTIIPTEIALSVLDSGPRALVMGVARNISDRLRAESQQEALEQQLARAQKLESIGRLAGGIAHDFNNLLTVINATTDLAIHELPEDSTLRGELGQVRAAGERAKLLTRQLLAFSRQQVLKREVLSLDAVASGFQTMLSRVIGEDIKVELRLGEHVPHILADAGQLEQVLMNLCINARDAMPTGGHLTISTERYDHVAGRADTPEGMPTGTYARLAVTDTGTGMDEETLAKVFEPFFTTKEVGQGTGLGLATVYGIVSQSGGYVDIKSALGKGTTVCIALPATRRVTPVEQPVIAPPRDMRGKETILIAEDEDAIRMVATRVLERAGYTVVSAASGEEALEQLTRHAGTINMLMTDLVMPGMTGLQLAHEVRRLYPTLKVLFASGYSADAADGNLSEFEGWNFIAKPYGVKELAAEVRRILDS
jgi:PAS domain S-box-containing protein